MGLTSKQVRAAAQRPRINQVEEDRMITMFVEGQSTKEVALQFPTWSQGTVANLRTRKREIIAERQRKGTVQFEDLT
jgi:hypothetical protein